MEPIISVIMSVYNDAEYINEAIESILRQSFTNFEFLIIDDASEDNSLEIIKQYASKDLRIRYFKRSKNTGVPKNSNFLISHAAGKYIARMDGNDVSLPNRLEEQLNILKNTNADVVWSNVIYIDEEGKDICLRYQPSLSQTLKELRKKKNFIVHPSNICKKEKIIKAGGYNEIYKTGSDGDLWFRILGGNGRFYLISKPLIKMRIEKYSLTSNRIGKNQDINYLYANCCMRNYQKRKSIRYIRRVKRLDLKANLLMRFIGVERIYQFIKGLKSIRYDEIHRI